MHRRALLDKLARHVPFDAAEADALARITTFIGRYPNCFDRSLAVGHITGSAWLIDPPGTHVLLTHHRKLGKWLQLGGHADGNPDVLAVAIREAQEESGIDEIQPVSGEVFDVDVHEIPARDAEARHFHYDIRFLLRAGVGAEFRVSEESHELAWVAVGEVASIETDDSVRRMCEKWRRHHCPLA
jgi:8-oxo-dGTP pyrophosphatase MutT (NUDIX family)